MEVKTYYLQEMLPDGDWKELAKSYEHDSLIYAGIQRQVLKRGAHRVIDNNGCILWHAEGAPNYEDAPDNS